MEFDWEHRNWDGEGSSVNINTLLPFHSTEKKTGLFQFHGPRKGAHVLSFNILGPFKKIVYYELTDHAEVFFTLFGSCHTPASGSRNEDSALVDLAHDYKHSK